MKNALFTLTLSLIFTLSAYSQANRPVISATSSLGNVVLGPYHDNSNSTSYAVCQPEKITITGWRFYPGTLTGYFDK